KVIAEDTTPEIVRDTMLSLDWLGFHQVVLERLNGDWLEVGGSLDPNDGLSVAYGENGKESVIKVPPSTVDEMITILLSYLANSEDWKTDAEWD
ncbi:MAG: hypothetical protein QGH94_09845, partial [Phycisphaerae bacterium]|nr:hypothetical protein [Phycisphaerae bacterium]